MDKVRNFIVKKPLLSTIILVLLVQAIFHFDVWFLRINLFETVFNISENMAETIKRIITTALCLLFMVKCLNDNLKDIGYKFKGSNRSFKICLIVIIFASLFHGFGLLSSVMANEGHFAQSSEEIRNAVEITIACFIVGVFEESAYRVVPINVLRNKQIKDERKEMFYCLVYSSILFGLIHLPNILSGYESLPDGIATIINAAGFGMLLGAMYWISGSIMPSIILHFIWDLWTFKSYFYISDITSAASSSGTFTIVFSSFVAIIWLVATLFILRKKKYQGCKITLEALVDQHK